MKKRVFFLLLAALMMPLAMNAQHNAAVHIDNTVNACVSYTWPVNGTTYTTSGVHTLISGDTLYILDLTISPEYENIVETPISGGCTFAWGDSVYSTSGVHTQTFQSVNGCDSTVTVTLNLATSATKSYTATACGSYIWKGDTLTTTGVTTITDTTGQCDSLLTLDLTILNPEQKSLDSTITACERIRFRWAPSASWITITSNTTLTSDEYSQSNATARALFHPRTVEKCYDSTVTLNFVINKNSTYTVVDKGCDSYTFNFNGNDRVYNYSKIDTISGLKASNGCDSLIVLNLTINRTPEVYISGDLRVTPGSNATLVANSNQEVSYRWSDGSTGETLTLNNVQSNTEVSLTGRNDTTECENTTHVVVMANVAIEDVNDNMLQLYPNPTAAKVNINSAEPLKSVSVFNLMGQQVINAGNASVIDLGELNNGSYVIRIEMQNGTVATRTVVLSK